MSNSRFSPKKKILFFAIAVVFGLSVGILLAEVGLRIAGPEWLRQFMVGTNLDGQIRYGSDAGWPVDSRNGKFVRFKPEKEFPVKYYEYNTTVHTDKWGGRVVPSSSVSDQRQFIPVLGDSFAFGLGVRDEETFVNLVSQKSNTAYLNLGAPGSSLPNQLDIIEFRHKELGSPDLYVFVFYLGNDFSDMTKYYEDAAKANPDEGQENRMMDFLENSAFVQRSYLIQFLSQTVYKDSQQNKSKRRSRIYRTPGGQRLSSSIYLLMSGSRTYTSDVRNVLNRSLDRLQNLSKDLHFKPAFIVIPDKHQTDSNLFSKQAGVFSLPISDLNRTLPDRVLEEQLERRNIPYVDVWTCLKDKSGMYYRMDDHLTAAGHRVVADCIDQDSNLAFSALKRVHMQTVEK